MSPLCWIYQTIWHRLCASKCADYERVQDFAPFAFHFPFIMPFSSPLFTFHQPISLAILGSIFSLYSVLVIIVSLGINPGFTRLPQSKNNNVQWMGIMLSCEKISSSAPGRLVMTLRECCVGCLFPDHVIRCWVRTRPPRSMGLGRLFKLAFWA